MSSIKHKSCKCVHGHKIQRFRLEHIWLLKKKTFHHHVICLTHFNEAKIKIIAFLTENNSNVGRSCFLHILSRSSSYFFLYYWYQVSFHLINTVLNKWDLFQLIKLLILGLTLSFLVKFQQNGNFTGDSYLKFNNEFTLPGFACSLCMRWDGNNIIIMLLESDHLYEF